MADDLAALNSRKRQLTEGCVCMDWASALLYQRALSFYNANFLTFSIVLSQCNCNAS